MIAFRALAYLSVCIINFCVVQHKQVPWLDINSDSYWLRKVCDDSVKAISPNGLMSLFVANDAVGSAYLDFKRGCLEDGVGSLSSKRSLPAFAVGCDDFRTKIRTLCCGDGIIAKQGVAPPDTIRIASIQRVLEHTGVCSYAICFKRFKENNNIDASVDGWGVASIDCRYPNAENTMTFLSPRQGYGFRFEGKINPSPVLRNESGLCCFGLFFRFIGLPSNLNISPDSSNSGYGRKTYSEPSKPIGLTFERNVVNPILPLCGAVMLLCGFWAICMDLWIIGWVAIFLSGFLWLPALPYL